MKDIVISLVSKQMTRWLITRVSFLAWGPLNTITSYFVTKIVTKILEQAILEAMILKIHWNVDNEADEVDRVVLKYEKSDLTEEERDKLDEELEEAARKLINFKH